jgi:two-component system, sensor histidine kinase
MQEKNILFCKDWHLFAELLDKSQDVFWIVNNDYSKQIYVSLAFERIWGYKAVVLYEQPLFWLDTILIEDKLHLDSISRLPHCCVRSYYQESYRIKRADGEVRWIEDCTYPIYNYKRDCIAYVGIARDITDALKLKQKLQAANKFLPKLAEKMENNAFWVRDPSLQKQLYVSKGFEKIWGRPVDFLYKHPEKWLETVITPEHRRDPTSMLLTLEECGPDTQYQDVYQIRRPCGEIRWVKDTGFPIFDDETNDLLGFAGIAQDITKETLYQIELQKAEIAKKVSEAKSNFIAGISHDLRTPLSGLLGIADVLRSGRCYPEQEEYIDAIVHAGNSLLDLVDDVINFVASDLNKLPINEEWFNLERLIKEIILTISQLALQKNIEISYTYSEEAPKEMLGDASRIRRVLMNLINNAIKFTNKGHVFVGVELIKQSAKKIWLQLVVEDTGIGISPENFDYIFGSFNRVQPSYHGRYQGTGLGLAIVKQFLEDIGGKIKLKSRLDQGTTFYCAIPFKCQRQPSGRKIKSKRRTFVVQ